MPILPPAQPQDNVVLKSLPGSSKQYTQAQIDDVFNPPDWFPNEHPPLPPGNLAAVINIDGLNFIGPTHDVNVIGLGKSSLDELVEGLAKWQNRVVTPDHFPDRGYYYRSDQFSLAKIGGAVFF